jgi:hypothetical protein
MLQGTDVVTGYESGMGLAADEHTLDPIVKILQTNDGRVFTLVEANLWASVICGCCLHD